MYTIHQFRTGVPPWERAETTAIDWFGWGGDYRPETEVAMLYQEEQGFWFRFRCREPHPLVCITAYNGEVCQDSCVEVFINFFPERDDRYLNLELNAAGVYLLNFGEKDDRRLVEQTGERLPIYTNQTETEWTVQAFLPQRLLSRLYGHEAFSSGRLLKGNFYKCSENAPRHYAAWHPVETPTPSFHRPEFFGSLIMGESPEYEKEMVK